MTSRNYGALVPNDRPCHHSSRSYTKICNYPETNCTTFLFSKICISHPQIYSCLEHQRHSCLLATIFNIIFQLSIKNKQTKKASNAQSPTILIKQSLSLWFTQLTRFLPGMYLSSSIKKMLVFFYIWKTILFWKTLLHIHIWRNG